MFFSKKNFSATLTMAIPITPGHPPPLDRGVATLPGAGYAVQNPVLEATWWLHDA